MKKSFRTAAFIVSAAIMLSAINAGVLAKSTKRVYVDGTAYIEAEDASAIRSPMGVVKDSAASGGKYAAPQTSSSMTSPQRDYAHLSYDINVPQDDAYFVWMRVRTTNTAKYYMCFDDGVYKKQVSLDNVAAKPNEWVWACFDRYWLKSGDHTLKIRYCSSGMQYDAFYITNDKNFTPEGAEPSIVSPYEIYQRDENGSVTNLYCNLPSYLPPDEHPRLLFRSRDIEKIKSNLTNEQNKAAYETLLNDAKYETDGKLAEIKYGEVSNIDLKTATMIEANAFLYQITGDKSYGRKAIDVSKNYMESAMIDETNASSTGRNMMWAIWSVACCYDWCYDLLTDEDKGHLIFYMVFNTKYSEPSYPPVKYGALNGGTGSEISGHMLEFQMLGGMMAVAVAAYDEIPDYYNVVAGRTLQYIVPAVNYYNESEMNSEGSSYGMYRHYYEILNNYIFKAMGYPNVYKEEGLSALGYFYLRQPDGERFMVGDDGDYYRNTYMNMNDYAYFLLGNMLGDSYFKTEYYRGHRSENKTSTIPGHLTPAMWLIMNDVDVPCDKSFRSFPLTAYSGDDSGYMFARTSWDEGFDSITAMCLMNLKTQFLCGHEHKDVGHFSLYYKGLLALDSGIYQGSSFRDSKGNWISSVGFGSIEHRAYARQSIAHNTMLVYDPNEKLDPGDANFYTTLDGGQRMKGTGWYAKTYDEIKTDERIKTGEVLSYNWGPDLNEPRYSYFKGDITDAYTDKVEKFQRSFMFFNFKDEEYPAALIVFDAVKSSSPTFKKTWLLHSEEEPKIDDNSVTITRETDDYHGRLINQTLMPDNGFSIKKVGQDFDGISKFKVGGTVYEMKPMSETAEVGNWRTEISATTAENQSYFLNVMQVSDNDEEITPLRAELIENTDEYAGVEIKNHIAYFRKDGDSKSKTFTINPKQSDDEKFFVITGLAEGKWSVTDADGKVIAAENVYKEHDSLSFESKGGRLKISRIGNTDSAEPSYKTLDLAKNEKKSIDVAIDGYYQTFENPWIESGDTLLAPVAEVLEKLDLDGFTDNGSSISVNDKYAETYEFTEGKDGVRKINGVLYAPVEIIKRTSRWSVVYDKVASIAVVTYGNRYRDRSQIAIETDPAAVQIMAAYTEGETTAAAAKSLDRKGNTYSCTIGEGSFTALLSEPTTISKVGLWWMNGAARQEIFEMYVSTDGENWKEVFSGKSDGKTNGYEYFNVGGEEKYRYVKVVCHGNTLNTYNSLTEIKVYK